MFEGLEVTLRSSPQSPNEVSQELEEPSLQLLRQFSSYTARFSRLFRSFVYRPVPIEAGLKLNFVVGSFPANLKVFEPVFG